MVRFRWFDKYSSRISVDLGTANTLIVCAKTGKVLLDEPSVIAIKNTSFNGESHVCAVGKEAKKMVGRTPAGMEVKRPLQYGVIANFQTTEEMLKHFLHQVLPKKVPDRWFRPEVVICVPYGSTPVERRAIKESAIGAGVGHVYLVDEPMAAAIGANLPVESASGSMVVDIGGGTTEIAIISLNGIVYAQSIRIGGDKFDETIISYVKRKFGCLIGEITAEKIKKTIGIAFPSDDIKELQVSGRNLTESIPRSFVINSNDVLEALQEPLTGIIDAIRAALENAPPELSADIEERGLMLTGGGALLRDIDRLIAEETRLPVILADEPLACVGRGGAKILEMLGQYGGEILTTED